MRYWLVKTEPAVYSIDDLKQDKATAWGGVRNFQARNYLKEMGKGDRVLVYHSNAGAQTGVVGEATVQRLAYPDPTQFDARGDYFEPAATTKNPRWFCPDLKFVCKYQHPIPLERLREDQALQGLLLLRRGSRLSVMPLEKKEFTVIATMATRCTRA